jgi:hypothetical protein
MLSKGYIRPLNHSNDMLSKTIDSGWECVVIEHLTKKEACILESKLIRMAKNRRLSKRGSYK